MKTFLLDTINRIKRFSESLDVKTALCDRPWVVFNDSGDKEVLIFDTDGNVLITVNGVGFQRTWRWVAANKSLIIKQPDETIVMLHPEYFNNSVMALNRDGTQEYAFLIDDNNRNKFAPKTLSELKSYFLAIEQKAIEEELKEKEEEQKKAEEEDHKEMLAKARYKFETSEFGCVSSIFGVLIITIVIAICLEPIVNDTATTFVVTLIIGIIITISTYLFAVCILPKKKAKKFIKENPDDELIPYIKEAYNIKERSI